MSRSARERVEAVAPVGGSSVEGGIKSATRIVSQDLFGQKREVEIDHHGRIYRLRITQANKLILTA